MATPQSHLKRFGKEHIYKIQKVFPARNVSHGARATLTLTLRRTLLTGHCFNFSNALGLSFPPFELHF